MNEAALVPVRASASIAKDQNPEELVIMLFGALAYREPDSSETSRHGAQLRRGADISEVMLQIYEDGNAELPLARRNERASTLPTDVIPALAKFGIASIDASKLFQGAYRAFLHRDAEDAGIAHYTRLYDEGTPLANLIAAIAGSEEANLARGLQDDHRAAGGEPSQTLDFTTASGGTISLGQLTEALDLAHSATKAAGLREERHSVGVSLAVVLNALGVGSQAPPSAPGLAVSPARTLETPDAVEAVVRILYREILRREASPSEVTPWYGHYLQTELLSSIVFAIDSSQEARNRRSPMRSDCDPGTLVQMAYEIIFDRGASASEVNHFRARMEHSGLAINDLVFSFFGDAMNRRMIGRNTDAVNDPSLAYLFGSHGVVRSADWTARRTPLARVIESDIRSPDSMLSVEIASDCIVSIVTSVYRGGKYIERFLENITAQTIFASNCELIIIDACSPDGEAEVIKSYMAKYPNITYKRYDSRIAIYEAWNAGVALSRGRYITNANLDDCRRRDSLEIQVSVLEALPFVDVTYQDVGFYFEENLTFPQVEAVSLYSNLPVVSRYNLMEFNLPHNGPMWRRSLHDEIGYFNEDYKSAADFEFWLRCHLAGKFFYKINDVHVGYYVNPDGLSTRPETRGVKEANAISSDLYRQIISPLLTMSDANFADALDIGVDGVKAAPSRYNLVQDALVRLGIESRTANDPSTDI